MIDLKDCTIQERTATLTTYNFAGTTPRGETLAVDFTAIHPDNSYKNSLPNLWHRHGFISYVLPSYWSVDVYVYDERGCWGRYNPDGLKPARSKSSYCRYLFNAPFCISAPKKRPHRKKCVLKVCTFYNLIKDVFKVVCNRSVLSIDCMRIYPVGVHVSAVSYSLFQLPHRQVCRNADECVPQLVQGAFCNAVCLAVSLPPPPDVPFFLLDEHPLLHSGQLFLCFQLGHRPRRQHDSARCIFVFSSCFPFIYSN